MIHGDTFDTKDINHSDDLKELSLRDEKGKWILSSRSYQFGREEDFEFLEGYFLGNIRGRFERV